MQTDFKKDSESEVYSLSLFLVFYENIVTIVSVCNGKREKT